MNVNALLQKNTPIIADGAMGTLLQKACAERKIAYTLPEQLNFIAPEIVMAVHEGYARAGSDFVAANTFGANSYKLSPLGMDLEQTIKAALEIARNAVFPLNKDILVALDCTTLGQLMAPLGTMTFEAAYDEYKRIFTIAERFGADFILLATMTDLLEVKAAILAAKENTYLPIFVTMTFEPNGRTFTGCLPEAFAMTATGLGADAIGVNCSLGPVELRAVVEKILAFTHLPVIVKPNAGLPDPATGIFSLNEADFARDTALFYERGARILGGCCGTSPAYISALVDELSQKKAVYPVEHKRVSAICSAENVVVIDAPRIIGERINPTGKPLMKAALREGDMSFLQKQAVEQFNDGAEILDVNVGLPGIDEVAAMVSAIRHIQQVTPAPLQIDSVNSAVLSASLRVYNGKPLVNSVNGDDKSLFTILPIVKKYGAAVLGLTLDEEHGVPKTAEERLSIAEKILSACRKHGIPDEDVYIDCLTLTVASDQESARETLKAVRLIKEMLGLKTVLGVSNISFGLPNRELLNSTFLTLALQSGLDLPIMNPSSAAMTGAVRGYRVLAGFDDKAGEYIAGYSGAESIAKTAVLGSNMTLEYALENALTTDAVRVTRELLRTAAPVDIIDNQLVPSLDRTGAAYENGRLYLPQLIARADTASACFAVIKEKIAAGSDSGESVGKGDIVLATVKGDIHDIGKNIVKALLESYGYHVIDLGRDCPAETIAEAVRKHDIRLVGLSALMTTTLSAMEAAIRLLKTQSPNCRIMVGGAVLTESYARSIGADWYSKNANGAVEYARKVFL